MVQAYHMYGVFQSLSRWISSLLVGTELSSNGDAIVVCIQPVYANSKWVGGCTCSRGLSDRSGPLVLLMPATHTAVEDWSPIARGYSQWNHVCYIHTSSLVMDDVLCYDSIISNTGELCTITHWILVKMKST